MNAKQKHPKNWKGFLLLALALVLVFGTGFTVWRNSQAGNASQAQTTPEASSTYKTTTVRRSDLFLSISGSGTVITAKSVDLMFSVKGTVAELNVQAGDT